MDGKDWAWQPARSDEVVNIQNKLSLVKIGEVDKAVWVISKKNSYTCSPAAAGILGMHLLQQISGGSWFWFSHVIPRQVFILWLAIRNSLTQGKSLWDGDIEKRCSVCFAGVLLNQGGICFFECGYSRRLWRERRGKSLKAVICRIVWSAAVYRIWRQRNKGEGEV